MPSRNSIKQYAPNSYYHIYNRGVEKRTIFHDDQDFQFFMNLLRRYLDPGYSPLKGAVLRPSYTNSLHLLAFCLMPSHFHLLLYQLDDEKAIEKLCRSVMTGYAMYFNQKYHRIGPLFQGRYKASLITSDSYLHHISRYIHLNPLDNQQNYESYPYSSYHAYSAQPKQTLIKTGPILNLFQTQKYVDFVDDYAVLFASRPKDSDSESISGLS